jgi:WD40 repeat protein
MFSRLPTLAASLLCLACLPAVAGSAAPPLQTDRDGKPLPPGTVARLGTRRYITPKVQCIVFSSDGKTLITGGRDGHLRVWEARTGRELRRFRAHGGWVGSLRLSPDGRFVAFLDNGLCLWNLATGKEVRHIKGDFTGDPELAFSSDGKSLAVGLLNSGVQVWDLATGKRKACPGDDESPASVAFSPDGKYLATGRGHAGLIGLWDTRTWNLVRTLKGHTRSLLGLAFTSGGKRLVSTGEDNTVRVWDVAAAKQLHCHHKKLFGDNPNLSLSPDARLAAVVSEKDTILCFDLNTGKDLWQTKDADCRSPAFSRDGKVLAAVTTRQILLWEAATGKRLNPTADPGDASLLSFSPDGKGLAVGHNWDGGVRLWSTKKGQHQFLARASGDAIGSFWWGPKRKILATTLTGYKEAFQLWDVTADKSLARLPKALFHAIIAPDGDSLFARTEDGIARWQRSTGKILYRYGERQWPEEFALSRGGKVLAEAGKARALWDARTGTLLGRFGDEKIETGFLTFTPTGHGLLSGGSSWPAKPQDTLYLWEVISGQLRLTLKGPLGHISAAAFSPDGRFLAVAMSEEGFGVWELASGKQVASRTVGHRGRVTALAFSPDGRVLASGGEDTTVLLWDVSRLASPKKRPAEKLTNERLEQLWQDRASDDAGKAYRAIWLLREQSGQVEPFLKRKLGKRPAVPMARVKRLIAELDSDEYPVREKASRELEKLGRSVRPALLEGLRPGLSLEFSRRLERLLGKLVKIKPGPEELRTSRALEVLCRVGTPQARQLVDDE